MSKPRKETKSDRYFKDIHFLYEIISSLKGTEELKFFLKEILTKSELRMLKRRWHILNLIIQGYDTRTVANMSGSSTQTVIKLKQQLEEGQGLQIALVKMEELDKKQRKEFLKSKSMGSSKFVKNWFS